MDKNIFNIEKTLDDYSDSSLFFGAAPGLFDTVNKRYPKIWDLYKEMKSLDWDENEFDYTTCAIDFKTCDPDIASMMVDSLAWQWEADSVASRAIIVLFAPFITDSSLWAAWQRISDNEVVHAATYSEIVRLSFDGHPREVLKKVLDVKESVGRMETVSKVFSDCRVKSLEYSLGTREYSQELYNTLYTTIATMFIMERVQFMGSFSITFTICAGGLFQPIGKAAQKIVQDELEVHVELGREVLRIERATERGALAAVQTKEKIEKILTEVINSEFEWLEKRLFAGGKSLPGTNIDIVKKWILYCAKDPVKELGLSLPFDFPNENPMPHLTGWIDMNKVQAAPQEENAGAYKVGVVINDDNSKQFEVDF